MPMEEPKALPCLHSFCYKCLSQYAEGKLKIKCPLCTQEFVIPRGGVKGFRTNFFINTLKEREATTKTLTSEETVAPCASCGSVDNKVEGYCSSCGGFVCKDCMGVHSRVKLFSDHKVILYDDLRSGKVDIRILSQKKYCKVHESQVLRFYCETCGVLICRDCTVVDHPAGSHNLVNLESATKGQRKEIEQLMQSCEGSKTTVENALRETDNVVDHLDGSAKTTEADIDKAFQKALQLLEDSRKRLKSEVKTIVSEKKKNLEAQKDEIQFQQTRLLTRLQKAYEVTQTGSDYDLALAYSSLKTNLTELQNLKHAPTKTHLAAVSFKPAQDSQLACLNLGAISPRYGLQKDGVGVWKLERTFGNDRLSAEKLIHGRGVAIVNHEIVAIADYLGKSFKLYNQNGGLKSSFTVSGSPWNAVAGLDDALYVTNNTNHVCVYDTEGNLKQQFTTKSPDNILSDAQNTTHRGLAIDNHYNLLVGEIRQKYISKHQLNGKHINSFKVSIQPWYIAVSPRDKIIVSCRFEGVHILDQNGVHLYSLKPPNDRSWDPFGMCYTADDTVYIANCDAGEIQCYSSETGAYIGLRH